MNLEEIIIGQLFLFEYNEQVEYCSQLKEKYFKNEVLKNYFKAIEKILFVHKKELDTITLYNEIGDEKWYSNIELSRIQSSVVSSANIENNIAMLKERHYRDEVIRVLGEKIEALKATKWHDELEEAKSDLIASLESIGLDFGSEFVDFNKYDELIKKNMDSESVVEGYSWGIDVLDSITNGITIPKMIVLGGLKKSGKSRFIINTRYALKKQGVYSPFISLEMPAMELAKLHYARELGISDDALRSGSLLDSEQVKLVKNYKIDWEYFPTECVASLSVNDIKSRIRKYSKLFPGCVVFIDYLQRIKHDRNKQASEIEGIANDIADATRDNNVSVVLLSQLQNIAEREIPTIGHLKGSGGIGESADTILLLDNLYRRNKDDESKKGMFKIYVEQRYGESGVVDVYGELGTSTYMDVYKKPHSFFGESSSNGDLDHTDII